MTVRVLIVDDSSFFCKRISDVISSDPMLEVVGMAENGLQAIEQTRLLKPDVITMDIEMPIMDGIAATREIMATDPTPILMLSTWSTQGAKQTLDALEAGAVDFMPKHFENISTNTHHASQQLCLRLHQLAQDTKKQSHLSAVKLSKSASSTFKKKKKNISLVAIGTSTGGPVALQHILTQLPATFPHPILLIQHMPAAFTPSFAERLNSLCKINVKLASDGEALVAGTAYLAPGGKQMLIKGNISKPFISILDGQINQTYKPSIDITFESISQICADETLAIILTGMGSDGSEGCRQLQSLGATIWAQDEKSSTVPGMPLSVINAGLADDVISLNNISSHLNTFTAGLN